MKLAFLLITILLRQVVPSTKAINEDEYIIKALPISNYEITRNDEKFMVKFLSEEDLVWIANGIRKSADSNVLSSSLEILVDQNGFLSVRKVDVGSMDKDRPANNGDGSADDDGLKDDKGSISSGLTEKIILFLICSLVYLFCGLFFVLCDFILFLLVFLLVIQRPEKLRRKITKYYGMEFFGIGPEQLGRFLQDSSIRVRVRLDRNNNTSRQPVEVTFDLIKELRGHQLKSIAIDVSDIGKLLPLLRNVLEV